MKKILFITLVDLSGKSGQNIYSKEVALSFAKRDDVDLYLISPKPKNKLTKKLTNNICQLKYLPEKNRKNTFWHIIAQYYITKHMRKVVKKNKIDLILSTMRPSLISLPFLVSSYNIPYYLLVEGMILNNFKKITDNKLYLKLAKYTYKKNVEKAEKCYVAFNDVKEKIKIYFGQKNKIKVFTNAVDYKKFKSISIESARKSLPFKKEEFVIGFVGSLRERHCLPLLLDSFKKADQELDKVKLLIVGEGPELQKLKKIVSHNNLEDKVVFTGFVQHNEVFKYISSCDVMYGVVHPNEITNPIKCYEYLSCERPIITSQKKELMFVEENDFGIVVNSLNKDNIYKAIKKLYKLERNERMRMGEEARNYIIKNHTWDNLTDEILKDIEV